MRHSENGTGAGESGLSSCQGPECRSLLRCGTAWASVVCIAFLLVLEAFFFWEGGISAQVGGRLLALIPKTCGCIVLYGRRDLADMIQLRT